jgi:uncharacterized Fe-S cluster-containing radical SAM superfamily protein
MYDPFELGSIVEEAVSKREKGEVWRKYYRFRGGLWYGGIATADAVGCNLKCTFCWGWKERDSYKSIGELLSPRVVAERLVDIAARKGYDKVRISGGEPTLAFEHLLKVLEHISSLMRLTFILETNGLLLGKHESYAEQLSNFPFLHVRVSIKGCTGEDFERITGAPEKYFYLQIKALENLFLAGVSVHPAVMVSFSSEEDCIRLKEKLYSIDESIGDSFEEEIVIMYPHVKEILAMRKLYPRISLKP